MIRSTPPSPLPPFHRPVFAMPNEVLSADGAASLAAEVTFLDSITAKESGLPYEITLPNGEFQNQQHKFYVPHGNQLRTATFLVRGVFLGFSALMFNSIAHSASLVWGGGGWHVLGGNVAPGDIITPPPIPEDAGTGSYVRMKNGRLQLKSPDTGLWYDQVLRNMGGAMSLATEGDGEA